ncbi:MAG: ribbon-helix-helix domain-containing protein, partial [Pseudolabrys sp.]
MRTDAINWFAFSELCRSLQDGGKTPLTTSVSLENEFWTALKEIAGDRHVTLSELFSGIDKQRQHSNLSSTLRLFVLEYYRG